MPRFPRLFQEIHRRSMWQVLGIYLAGSWVALEVIDGLTGTAGLPEWVPAFALVLLIIGLPIVLATAFLQGGMRSRRGEQPSATSPPVAEQAATGSTDEGPVHGAAGGPPAVDRPGEAGSPTPAAAKGRHHRLFTWRNALLGGAAAFALLGLVTAGYVVMRTAGIGPAGTLVAKGVLEAKERIVLADFGSLSGDEELAAAATLALRVDLGESPVVTLIEPRTVAGALSRMARDPDEKLTRKLATEVAVREGIKAVVAGDVSRAGKNFVVSAELIASADGQQLLSHRETASDSAGIVPAIDRLSRKLRERIGESLRSIAASPRLEEVTTSSMEALRLYADAVEAIEVTGNRDRGIALLEEALERDSTFAMGWRKLGVELGNLDELRERQIEALTKAYEHRDRLTKRERYLAEAAYHEHVFDDLNRTITAYRNLLDLNPDDTWALNNLANVYLGLGQSDRSEELLERAVVVDSSSAFHFGNLVVIRIDLGKLEEAEQTAAAGLRLFPDNPLPRNSERWVAFARGEYEAVAENAREVRDAFPEEPVVRRAANLDLARSMVVRGKVSEAREALREARRADEERGAAPGYWQTAIAEAFVELEVRGDARGAVARLDEAEERYPIESLAPLERSYEDVARLSALAGESDRARALLAHFDESTDRTLWTRGQKRGYRLAEGDMALARGDVDGAIEVYRDVDYGGCSVCESLNLARAYEQAGETDSVIVHREHYVSTPDFVRLFTDPTNLGPAYERLGELYDAQGDLENAAKYYAMFVELWAEADEELLPRVRAAQRRLEEIVAERG